MQVAKWGNSLAVRLPAKVVRKMKLKPGDQIEIRPRGARILEVVRDAEEQAARDRRLKALQAFRALREQLPRLPQGHRFSRAEIYGENYRGRMEAPES